MGLLAVELNDSGIIAVRSAEDGPLPVDGDDRMSPGVVWLRKEGLVIGAAAAREASLHPLAIDNRFWDRLDIEPVDPKYPHSPNRAEVACAHLKLVLEGVREPDEKIVIAVPPDYDQTQLGILVAIARELKVPLAGLVVSPIALAPRTEGTSMLVEIGLHRAVLSIVEDGERITLGSTRMCPDVGLDTFRRQWVKAIGGEFVRTTRFDPLHDAASEQRLHDGLPAILDAVAEHGSCPLALEAGGLEHRVTVTDQLLESAGHSLIFALSSEVQKLAASSRPSAIILAHAATRVPGLRRMLRQQLGTAVDGVEAGAAARGLIELWPRCFETSEVEGIAYHTWRHATPVAAPAEAS